MANRDGEYCFSIVSFFLEFLHFLRGVSDQLLGHLILYDVGNAVILVLFHFLL